jgi:hypothetical protein
VSLKILIAGCLKDEKDQIEDVVKDALGGRQEAGPWNVSLVKLGTSWSIDLDGPEPDLQGISLSATDDSLKETIVGAIGSNGSAGNNGAEVDAAPTASSAPTASAAPAAKAAPAAVAAPIANTAPARNAAAARTAAPTGNPVFPTRNAAATKTAAPKNPVFPNAAPTSNPVPTGSSSPVFSNSPLPSLEEMEADEGLLAQTTGATLELEPEPTKSKPDGNECEACGRYFRVIYEAEPNEPKVTAPVACPHCWQMTDVPVAEGAAATQEYRAEAIDS